jgi:hypothetical protein
MPGETAALTSAGNSDYSKPLAKMTTGRGRKFSIAGASSSMILALFSVPGFPVATPLATTLGLEKYKRLGVPKSIDMIEAKVPGTIFANASG